VFNYSRRDATEVDLSFSSAAPVHRQRAARLQQRFEPAAAAACHCPPLDEIGRAFRQGFVCGIQGTSITRELAASQVASPYLIGVFMEGAAMSCALLDAWTPWKKGRWLALLASVGERHIYEIHVGLGMALARANQRLEPWLRDLDPVLRWLVVDGYGFHHGFFESSKYLSQKNLPAERVGKGHQKKVFDQGLGRSLWFACQADVRAVITAVRDFPPARQCELWSGIGVAATMVGGAGQAHLTALYKASGRHRCYLAQGAAFAAHVRERAGTRNAHTETACAVLCGVDPSEASALVEKALRKLSSGGPKHLHETWQVNVRNAIARFLREP
jgi:hypothetical protein